MSDQFEEEQQEKIYTRIYCPVLKRECLQRKCGWYNPYEKVCAIIGFAGLNTNLWKIHNLIKYGEKNEHSKVNTAEHR